MKSGEVSDFLSAATEPPMTANYPTSDHEEGTCAYVWGCGWNFTDFT